ncbi:MAG: hypothetical protein ACJ776_08785 [Chloroflexota bacterium]
MIRFVDRGAKTAAYVGIGTAVTIVASFTLIIPIEWLIWLLVIPVGLTIGYYANQRSNRRRGPLSRILVNGTFAALVTGVSMAVLLLVIKAIFFFADGGYPDFNRVDESGAPIPPSCVSGADCVYQRYVQAGRGPDLAAAGVTDADSFSRFYWNEQLGSALTIVLLTTISGAGGAALYWIVRPKPVAANTEATTEATPS